MVLKHMLPRFVSHPNGKTGGRDKNAISEYGGGMYPPSPVKLAPLSTSILRIDKQDYDSEV